MVNSLPSSSAVMTSLSPAMIGDDNPLGARTFHLTFLSGPNSTGGFWPMAMPDPPGPRNCGHASGFSPLGPPVANSPVTTNAIRAFMSNTSRAVERDLSRESGHYRIATLCQPPYLGHSAHV